MLHLCVDEEKSKKLSDFSKWLVSYNALGKKEGTYWVGIGDIQGQNWTGSERPQQEEN